MFSKWRGGSDTENKAAWERETGVVDGRFERENMGEGERGFFSGDRAEVDERRRSQPINRRRASTRTHSLTCILVQRVRRPRLGRLVGRDCESEKESIVRYSDAIRVVFCDF